MQKTLTRYPIILVHGIIFKDTAIYKSFGKIEKLLRWNGYRVFTAPTDGFGTIEGNGEQLKEFIEKILKQENAEKVNLIAHSKGGLDCKYVIQTLGLRSCVASLTTLCTPHFGSPVASYILRYPRPLLKFIAFFINLWYRIFKDKHPDCLRVCEQLQQRDEPDFIDFADDIYCQSYSSDLTKRSLVMFAPRLLLKRLGHSVNDGLVTEESMRFGHYRGHLLNESISHAEAAGCVWGGKKRKRIVKRYLQITEELADMGF